MHNKSLNKERGKWQITLGMFAIALGLSLAGYFIKEGITHFKRAERTVVVKGISEREVYSDLAVWNLNFRNSGDDLALLNNKMAEDRKFISDFLKNIGFTEAEIQKGEIEVIDKMAREYGDRSDAINRYIIKENLIIRTNRIDLIRSCLKNVN